MSGGPEALVARLAGRLAFAGVAWSRGGRDRFAVATDPGIAAGRGGAAGRDTMFRCASISKVAVAGVLAEALGAERNAAADVSDLLGWRCRHPGHPEVPVTLGMVAAHHAGLDDGGGYLPPAEATLEGWLARPGVWAARPGERFAYSNLGYLVLAAVAEAATGERFDRLASRWLGARGVAGGFNWSGVADRADRLACYRRAGGAFAAQVDGVVPADGVATADGGRADLSGWRAGANPAPFSPQGGLRTSLAGCLSLARGLREREAAVLWHPGMGPTEGPRDVFRSYGWGLQIQPAGGVYPRPLIGHFAVAYGFLGGIWYDREADLAFAYGLNGLPVEDGRDEDDFWPEERAIFAAMAELGG